MAASHDPDTPRILTETVHSLPQLAARIPGLRPNGRINTSTLTRWILRGVRRRDGVWVRLEAAKSGSKWLTSWEAYGRFVAALTPPDLMPPGAGTSPTPRPPSDGPRTPHARQKASEAAAQELGRRGV